MVSIYNNPTDLFNKIVHTNTKEPVWTNTTNSIPISNKYFLTILDHSNINTINFINYINNTEYDIEYPFEKDANIDYSFMIESEQLNHIDLETFNLNKIGSNLDIFFQIVSESDGDIILVIDINYLLDKFNNSKNIVSNHLIDFILWKLKNKLNYIFVLDEKKQIKFSNNLLLIQFEICLVNWDASKYNFDNNLIVYKDINDNIFNNVYWNILYPNNKITEYLHSIDSPYKNLKYNFSLIKINLNNTDKECFLGKINLFDIIYKNLLNLNNDPGIIIDPSDRIDIQINWKN